MHSDDLGRRLGHSHETRKTSAFYILNFFDGQSLRFLVQVRAGDERFRCPFGFATPGTHDRDDDYHRVRRCNLGAKPIHKRFQIANFFQSEVVPVRLAAGASKQLGGLSSSYVKQRLEQWAHGYDASAVQMPKVARSLSPHQIEALASFLSFVGGESAQKYT